MISITVNSLISLCSSECINPWGHSFLLGNQAEFFKDALYPDRFWLCVGQELIDNFGFTIQQAPGQVLPVLYPVPPSPPLLMNGHIVPQYQLQAPELPIVAPDDVPHFTNAAPIDPSLPANDPPANADQFVDGPGVEAYQCADVLPVGAPQLAINPAPLDSHQFAISLPVEAPQYPAMPPSPIIATNQHAGPNEQAPQIPADPAPEEPAQPEGATNPRKRKASPDEDEDEDEEEDKDGDEEKQPKKKIKRPRNNWILFRMSENEKLQKEKPGSGVSYVCKYTTDSTDGTPSLCWYRLTVCEHLSQGGQKEIFGLAPS